MHFKKDLKKTAGLLLVLLFVTFLNCKEKDSVSSAQTPQLEVQDITEKQKKIVDEYLKNGAWKHRMFSQEWQEEIDKGLAQDSTIAYLWQQKAMPLFKQRKYEVGMGFLDRAVALDSRSWQDYRAFIKCIFAKTYREAIRDFQSCKEKFGNGYVMDHSYNFYIALSYLQLNEFSKAESILQEDYDQIISSKGADWLHHLDLFYFGISKYEQKKYTEAISLFDKALEIYPKFAEAMLFKARCLEGLDKTKEAEVLFEAAVKSGKEGNTINEDNAIYERYPYQVNWN